jgi:FdhE protein
MPPVALEPATRQSRLAEAARRWDALQAAQPDLAPAVDLQRQLLGTVIDLMDVIDGGRMPRLSLPPKYLAAKLARGVPALSGEPIPLPVAVLTPTLIRLCEELAAGGAGETAEHIKAALVETRMDAGSLLTASLARDQQAIRVGAAHRGLAPDLVWLVAELAVSPVAYALQRALFAPASADAVLSGALSAWPHGYCPSCSSWPAIAEVLGGRRALRCSFCAYAWDTGSHGCVYCGESGDKFLAPSSDASLVEARRHRRLEICNTCRSYMKAVDVVELSPFPLVAIADLETMDLDMAAIERGYTRPPLKEFNKTASAR